LYDGAGLDDCPEVSRADYIRFMTMFVHFDVEEGNGHTSHGLGDGLSLVRALANSMSAAKASFFPTRRDQVRLRPGIYRSSG
jgi:hypothetical protein